MSSFQNRSLNVARSYSEHLLLCGPVGPHWSRHILALVGISWRLGSRSCRFRCRFRSRTMGNGDVNDLDRPEGPVVAWIGGHARNLFHQLDAGIITLTEDGVTPTQMSAVSDIFGDEELRSVRVRARVGICQSARPVEPEVGGNFVFELVAGITGSIARRIAALDHEFRDDAMK